MKNFRDFFPKISGAPVDGLWHRRSIGAMNSEYQDNSAADEKGFTPWRKNPVGELRNLLDGPALMVPCPWGLKECFEKWRKRTIEAMNNATYLKRLESGNIGVVLGDQSKGLCTIDIDSDDEVQPFLDLNPRLKATLRTKGKRGCNLWFRVRGSCPSGKPLKRRGEPWGEFRGNGNQTILYGKHPAGMRYQIVNKVTPIELALEDIQWPEGMEGVASLSEPARNRTDDTDDTDETDEVRNGFVARLDAASFPLEALDRAVPTQAHDNHARLFHLAREVRTFEEAKKGKFDTAALRSIFERWAAAAKPHLAPEQEIDTYFMEFLSGYDRVKCLIGEKVLLRAWEKALKAEPPTELAGLFSNPKILILACLCRELQREAGKEPFFLSCRTVAKLFEKVSISTASVWLRGLDVCGAIQTVEKGNPKTNKASRYRYLFSLK
jgi:hypothetical protein